MVAMCFGNSRIFAPMTTAGLNSVETAKSAVASAANGAVRETGFAFGIALLGTIMNRTYVARYDSSAEIRGLRENPEFAPFRPVVETIGSGINFAGRLVENAGNFPEPLASAVAALPATAIAPIREASSQAFVAGMDRAFIISSIAIIVASGLSYLLIKDRVAAARTPGADPASAPLAEAAD